MQVRHTHTPYRTTLRFRNNHRLISKYREENKFGKHRQNIRLDLHILFGTEYKPKVVTLDASASHSHTT